MKNNEEINNLLEQLNDVSMVMNFEIFIYLDLFLLSFFLGFLLYSQLHHWQSPFLISLAFFLSSSFIFKVFVSKHDP